MTDGITPRLSAWLDASKLKDHFGDMSAAEINALNFTEYSKIREAAGLPAADPFAEAYAPEPPGRPREAHPGQAPQAVPEHALGIKAMGMSEYTELREHLGIGRSASARGLFD
ncbi:MAG: hypothetical protein ACRDNZ_14235 [Streptosporangiaceae bacterium]